MLDRLERPDGAVELVPLLRVGEGHVEDVARGAHHLGCDRHVGAVAPSREHLSGNRLRVEHQPVGVEMERPPREIERRDEAEPITELGTVDGRDRRPGTDHRDPLDPVGFEHERVDRVVDERDRTGPFVVAGQRRIQRGGEEGSGRGRVPGLGEEQAQVGRGTGTQRGVLAQMPPQGLVHGRFVDVRAHERGRALAVEQLVGRVAQELLVVGEGEVHTRFRLSGARAPAGR